MNTLETKMAAVLRLLTAESDADRQAARNEIISMMDGAHPIASPADPEAAVRQVLLELGAPDHLLGHQYAVAAILLVAENQMYIHNITSGLYPRLAAQFGTTASRVERGIHHLVETAWSRCDIEVLNRYFGNTVSADKGKPTNGEFIARLANVVKQRMKQ